MEALREKNGTSPSAEEVNLLPNTLLFGPQFFINKSPISVSPLRQNNCKQLKLNTLLSILYMLYYLILAKPYEVGTVTPILKM